MAELIEKEKEVSSGIIVYRFFSDGARFLVLYHGNSAWSFPKGKIQKEESSFQAALRETHEETGLSRNDMRLANGFRVVEHFTFKRFRKDWNVRKTVIFYLARTSKKDITLSKEHKGFGWFSYREALRLFPQEKHKDTRRILKQAFDFLKASRAKQVNSSHPRGQSSDKQRRTRPYNRKVRVQRRPQPKKRP